jgi:hypothetical protein
MILSTERLGLPGAESPWLERAGFVQRRLVYPNQPDEPTELCHLQPADSEPALCGFPWEALVAVPGDRTFGDIDPSLRCERCEREWSRAAPP